MKTSRHSSLPTAYFDKMYQENIDPWQFETSVYERNKYAATLAALPKNHYQHAFEIGCSIGVLTEKLASRCERLLAVDGSQLAVQKAQERLQSYPQVCLRQMKVPDVFPEERFDLILVSEVGYYWSWHDLEKAQRLMLRQLLPAGHLLLVHWTPYVEDYPLTGDEVHEAFMALTVKGGSLTHLMHQRERVGQLAGQEYAYRLDLFERQP